MAKLIKPLQGIVILDFTRLIPGPFCTKILSDMGAEVIKIEDAGKGDYLNIMPPQLFSGESVLSVYLNKNKKRLKIDYYKPDGQEIIKKLVRRADVVIESFRPGVMKRLGLDFSALRRIQKKLLYVSLSGFGQKGGRASLAGHDLNFMAVSGLLEDLLPTMPRFHFGDFVGGGYAAALQIVATLFGQLRNRKAVGLHLDVNLTQAMTYLRQHQYFSNLVPDLRVITGALPRYQVYQARDGRWVALGAFEDKFWDRFCEVIDHPEWKGMTLDQNENEQLRVKLQQIFCSRTAQEWDDLGAKNDLCLTAVATRDELIKHGILKSSSVRSDSDVKTIYEVGLFGTPATQKYARAGAHNRRILKSLGYSAKQIQNWYQSGVLV